MKKHFYKVDIQWTGNKGNGTESYKAYNREHSINIPGKYDKILGSSDPNFMGDSSKYNPEELFLSSLSTCHMLWYLHLCSQNGISVIEYQDEPHGIMEENKDGSGKFIDVTLYPKVKISDERMIGRANELHEKANEMCFIANSCNFKIKHQPKTTH